MMDIASGQFTNELTSYSNRPIWFPELVTTTQSAKSNLFAIKP